MTRPHSHFNANKSIQIKLPPLSPHHRSNNNQKNIQTKIKSTNYTQPVETIEQDFVGWVRKSWRRWGKNMLQEMGTVLCVLFGNSKHPSCVLFFPSEAPFFPDLIKQQSTAEVAV
jgi:hypothetical protein